MFVNGIVVKCAGCGAPLPLKEGTRIVTCDCCGNVNTIPSIREDRKADFEKAKDYRRAGEFDRALEICTDILKDVNDSAELYWEILMSKYGVIFVKNNHETIPTIQRMQTTSIKADQDFLMAIKYSTPEELDVYNKIVDYISEMQKKYLEIIEAEKQYDIFISYKETDEQGKRTKDSLLAETLYNDLKEEGYRVFFSRISLEDKLGQEYEPYIYAALHSAKVLLLVSTQIEYVNSVWVKNEWKRFLGMMKNDNSKFLIPAYCDMKVEEFPEELKIYQSQDLSKIGCNRDVIRGIKKIFNINNEKKVISKGGDTKSIDSILEVVKNKLCVGLFDDAMEDAYEILKIEPQNEYAYLYLMMADFEARDIEELIDKRINLADSKYAEGYFKFARNREILNKLLYSQGMFGYRIGEYKTAKWYFEQASGFLDSEKKSVLCKRKRRMQLYLLIAEILIATIAPLVVIFSYSYIYSHDSSVNMLGFFVWLAITSLTVAILSGIRKRHDGFIVIKNSIKKLGLHLILEFFLILILTIIL